MTRISDTTQTKKSKLPFFSVFHLRDEVKESLNKIRDGGVFFIIHFELI